MSILPMPDGTRGELYRKLLEVPEELAQDDKDSMHDPALLLKQRDQIARAIEALSRFLTSPIR